MVNNFCLVLMYTNFPPVMTSYICQITSTSAKLASLERICSTFAIFFSTIFQFTHVTSFVCKVTLHLFIYLFILNKIQWPATLNHSFPSPTQMCVSTALSLHSPSSTTSASFKSTNQISAFIFTFI